MEGDIHCLLGWVGALANPSPVIFSYYRSVNPGVTMTLWVILVDVAMSPVWSAINDTGHAGRSTVRGRVS
jgi:hypothetical protein